MGVHDVLTIHSAGTHVLDHGQDLPLIIDTLWSAFADPTEDEWRIYLATRRQQGFNAMLVSVLPILHDRVDGPDRTSPFGGDAVSEPRYDRPLNDEYFHRARRFSIIAREEFGMVIMPCVLWNSYLPGTWGAAATPAAVMPADVRREVVTRVAHTFADLDVIFVVGGDDHYDVSAAVDGYLEAIEILRTLAPDCLLTTHTAPRAVLPAAIADRLDLFLHQSGHNVENQDLPATQPQRYLDQRPRRPLINSEPPYELHGKVGGHGRWTRDDVRRASWTSVLAGASAGIGYGAHGTWMWATSSGRFEAEAASLAPFPWPECVALPGALDISLLAALMARHRLFRLEPAQDLLVDDRGGAIRTAASSDGTLVVCYLPFAVTIELAVDADGFDVSAWDLHERAPLTAVLAPSATGTTLGQLTTQADQLVVLEKR